MWRRTDPITVFLFGNYAHPMLPFIMMEVVFRWWQYSRGKFSRYKWSSARITNKNWFGTLKARLRCLQRSMDININILLQIFCLCLQFWVQLFWVTEGTDSKTEFCVNPEFWETSVICDKQFIIEISFERKEINRYLLIP